MLDLATATMTLVFEFGRVRDAVMRIDVLVGDTVHTVPCEWDGDSGRGTVSVPVCLPTTVTVVASGKGPMDTLVDEQGNIIQDCHACLREVYLDGFKLGDYFLYHKVMITADDGHELVTNYFGFNGRAVIDLPKKSVFAQYCFLNQTN